MLFCCSAKAARQFHKLLSCVLIKMVALRPEYICAVWLWLYLSSPPSLFSLVRGQESQELGGCQKRPARRAAETFTSRAGRDAGSDPGRKRRRGEKKTKKSERSFWTPFFFLFWLFLFPPPRVSCRSLTVFARLLLAGGKCRVGRLYCLEDRGGGGWGVASGSESSAEERNKCINNKEDMTSGGGAVQRAGWVCGSVEESGRTHVRVRLCVQCEWAPLYCPVSETRLVRSLSRAAGLCSCGECLKGGRTLQERARARASKHVCLCLAAFCKGCNKAKRWLIKLQFEWSENAHRLLNVKSGSCPGSWREKKR